MGGKQKPAASKKTRRTREGGKKEKKKNKDLTAMKRKLCGSCGKKGKEGPPGGKKKAVPHVAAAQLKKNRTLVEKDLLGGKRGN